MIPQHHITFVHPTLQLGYVTKDLNNIQSQYRVIVNPVKQYLNQSFIKENVLKHYTNCTVTSITSREKKGGGVIIWCGDAITQAAASDKTGNEMCENTCDRLSSTGSVL